MVGTKRFPFEAARTYEVVTLQQPLELLHCEPFWTTIKLRLAVSIGYAVAEAYQLWVGPAPRFYICQDFG